MIQTNIIEIDYYRAELDFKWSQVHVSLHYTKPLLQSSDRPFLPSLSRLMAALMQAR